MGKSQDCKRGLDAGDRPRAGEANSLRALEAPNFKKKLSVVYNKIKESNHLVFSIFIS